jgi:enoyl-CoA hydratase/carnithine racemase
MADPKRHHYVPQWYLGGFTADPERPVLACYSKKQDRFLETSVKNVAVIGHHNTWFHDGEADPVVEKGMAILDARAAEVVPKLERMQTLVDTEPNVVATYVAMQLGRVPAAREVFQEMIEEIGRAETLRVAASGELRTPEETVAAGLAATVEEAEDLRRQSIEAIRERRVKVTMDHVVTASVAAINAEILAPFIELMSWLVVYAPPGHEFLTSDNPVVLMSDETPPGVPITWMTPDLEVSMPLSKNAMLLIGHAHNASGWSCGLPEGTLYLNRRRWLAARDFVYGPTEEALRRVCEGMPKEVRTAQLAGMKMVDAPWARPAHVAG